MKLTIVEIIKCTTEEGTPGADGEKPEPAVTLDIAVQKLTCEETEREARLFRGKRYDCVLLLVYYSHNIRLSRTFIM